MKGFDCRDESLWIPKYNYVSGYKARSIHLRWLDFSGEGAIGGWKHTAPADTSAISRFQLSRRVSPFKDLLLFFWGRPEKKMKFVNVSSKTWSPVESVAHTFTQSRCRGLLGLFWCISAHLKCDLPHLRLSTVAKFLATVTKGIVLFYGNFYSPFLDCPPIKVSRLKYPD